MTECRPIFLDRTFLVTGASSGIGRATAQALGNLGARVLLNGRNVEALQEVGDSIPGGRGIVVPHALSDLDDACAWVIDLAQKWGPLDGLVHSAGTRSVVPLRALKQEAADKEFNLHVLASMGLIKGFRYRRQKGMAGSIVLISSVMGLVGAPIQVSYSAAKAAMVGLARSAALELAPENIRVNVIAPGCVQTGMLDDFRKTLTEEQFQQVVANHPLGLGRSEDVADAAVFLLGETSRWITGTTLVVDGGYTAQ